MQLAMYKGPARSLFQKAFHAAVCLITRSKYSHCELVPFERAPDGTNLCLSSSQRDSGVRMKRIDLSTGHWDVFDMKPVSEEAAARAVDWFVKHNGQGYDYLGLLWFVVRVRLERPGRHFCSEAIAAALDLDDPHLYSPQILLEAVCRRDPKS